MNKQIWKTDNEKELNPAILEYISNEDLGFDKNLIKHDIQVNKAHAKMLEKCGLLTKDECEKLLHVLKKLEIVEKTGNLKLKKEFEDVHMNIEYYLTRELGDLGKKIHTARSRNDQVMADMALWMMESAEKIKAKTQEMISALENKAAEHAKVAMPVYTHMQPAQKITVGRWLGAYAEMLKKDLQHANFFLEEADECPLGACACAGTTLPIKPYITAQELGFSKSFKNALAAVSSRGELETKLIFVCSMIMLHLNKLANDLQLYSTFEFGLVKLPDDACTSSSIMPQKKNPDALEILHAKTAETHSLLIQNLMILKSLPSGFQRDTQQTKSTVMKAVEIVMQSIDVLKIVLSGMELDAEKMNETIEKGGCLATEEVSNLVLKGIPFREAYKQVREKYANK